MRVTLRLTDFIYKPQISNFWKIENFKDRQFSKPQLQSVSILFSFAHPWLLVYLLCNWNPRSMFKAVIYTTLLDLLARS